MVLAAKGDGIVHQIIWYSLEFLPCYQLRKYLDFFQHFDSSLGTVNPYWGHLGKEVKYITTVHCVSAIVCNVYVQ